MEPMLIHITLVVGLGVLSQWLAWRFKLPAIVVMSIIGLLTGPILGLIDPKAQFAQLFDPFVSIAVAVILFEGSLNLDMREVRGIEKPVFRIVTLGALLAWVLGSLAAHYIADLSWAVAIVIGGLFIVTGPTVILPLLRQAKLKPKPAAILKWEGIIVDPFGALLAVFSFEIVQFLVLREVSGKTILFFFAASIIAVLIGWLLGRGIGWMFQKGHIPEYLKSPVVFIVVIACFTIADEIKHETGLLAVTAMGITLANMHISSISDMRHFKENISVLLTSTIFIMLTAGLTMKTITEIFHWNIILFVLLMLFIVRPVSIFLSTVGTDLSIKEKILIGWIAPRGIVALTVSSYFAKVLIDEGFKDASILTTLTFALVFATVCAHGFSLSWLAKKLDLSIGEEPGILLVGSNDFTVAFASKLKQLGYPVLVADSSWERLRTARRAEVDVYHGEVLAEQTEYHLDLTPYEYVIAATELDAYNALVCTAFLQDMGRNNVFQLSIRDQEDSREDVDEIMHTVRGRMLFKKGITWEFLHHKMEHGYTIYNTKITDEYTYETYLEEKSDDSLLLAVSKQGKALSFFAHDQEINVNAGDTVLSLQPLKR
ncbi:cation:proton antiporter [Priestia megaterium]|uniref:cation:proton antiporter n=1 Tax=Priestia megaterium TaxID=1404 RepID=UPI000D519497|nr:sodium:proton antiporter [Priestia megaterium]PVE71744.1 sodium:proton exchanger [Priestia megaterium]PVE80880.1 sodium:proton exchanger [Priestia megaterium]PVE92003.1 sodium:proton exchanger [Priestia megaterium]PVF00815.1 sodium:proton exchanger [Priestia megaterium]